MKSTKERNGACSELPKLGQFQNILVGCEQGELPAEGETENKDGFTIGAKENRRSTPKSLRLIRYVHSQ